jgi:hypothetical protein
MTAQPKYEVYTICGVTHTTKDSIEADFWAELAQIQAESIGWIPLDEGAYLRKLPQIENNMKIEASISLRRRDEEVKVHGEPDCCDLG